MNQRSDSQYGADILRLWVASSDYKVDIRISMDILKQVQVYRKIRNTARFMGIYDLIPTVIPFLIMEWRRLTDGCFVGCRDLLKKSNQPITSMSSTSCSMPYTILRCRYE